MSYFSFQLSPKFPFLSGTAFGFVAVLPTLLALVCISIYRQRHRTYPPRPAEQTVERGKTVPGPEAPLTDLIPADELRISRGDWVSRLTSHVCRTRHAGCFNVLVFNTAVERHFIPEGVVEQFLVVYDSTKESLEVGKVTYEVTVFRKGHLVNLGDGGYINWCFEGNFERVGMSAIFAEIREPDDCKT